MFLCKNRTLYDLFAIKVAVHVVITFSSLTAVKVSTRIAVITSRESVVIVKKNMTSTTALQK